MGRMMAGGGPDQRSLDLKGSGKRLVAQFRPERLTICVLLLCVVLSVGLNVVGPKILGKATDLVFAGIVGRDMPDGASKEQVLDSMRQRGTVTSPTCCAAPTSPPARASTSRPWGTCCCSRWSCSRWPGC
jgi:hypothetical protein